MRKIIALLLCGLLLAQWPAAVAEPFDLPMDDAFTAVTNGADSIEIEIDGSPLSLTFDSSEEYSSVLNGIVQASFYAYSGDSEYLYELFLTFPEDVEAGSSITPEYALQNAPLTSVVMIISSRESEQYYYAGQSDGAIYPEGCSYSIDFDSVSETGTDRTYSGKLSATLVTMNADSAAPTTTFQIESAPFSFAMPMENISNGNDYNPFDDLPPRPLEPSATTAPEKQKEAVRV